MRRFRVRDLSLRQLCFSLRLSYRSPDKLPTRKRMIPAHSDNDS